MHKKMPYEVYRGQFMLEKMINTPKIAVKRCSNNPRRWYVSFNASNPFSMQLVLQSLEKQHYQVLASSPSISVFQSKGTRLTWHTHGLIQIDSSNSILQNPQDIEQFIKEILMATTEDFTR